MDEEDMEDAEEARKLGTTDGFSGLGSTQHDVARSAGLAGLFRAEGETMGVKLLRKMGWREGQGIGPKVRRRARTGMGDEALQPQGHETFLFAPDDVPIINFDRKTDRKGLGFEGETGLRTIAHVEGGQHRESESDEDPDDTNDTLSGPRTPLALKRKSLRMAAWFLTRSVRRSLSS
jgi:G patch domain-containing protein 1